MAYLEVQNLTKKYGTHDIIKQADFSIREKEIVGFIGPNGAGKTTLLKILAGLSSPTSGKVILDGQDVKKATISRGLMLETAPFVEYFSGADNLRLLARISRKDRLRNITKTLQYVGLDPSDKKPVKKYSMGMRQRLGLAQAIMENPTLLLLDEPTNGLDPQAIVEFRSLIKDQVDRGATVLILSHMLSEVTKLCNRVFIVFAGVVQEVSKADLEQFELEEIYLRAVGQLSGGQVKHAD